MSHKNEAGPDLATRYDEWAGDYDQLTQLTNYQGGEWIRERIDFFREGSAQVLDLGCADGYIARLLHELRPEYVFDGLDFSQGMIKSASQTQLYRTLGCVDLGNGLPTGMLTRYDYITALAFLEFIENTDKLMQDIQFVLNPDGLAFMTFQKTNPDLDSHIQGIDYYTFDDTDAILNYLQGMQFNVIQIEEGVGYWDVSDGMARDYFFVIAGLNK